MFFVFFFFNLEKRKTFVRNGMIIELWPHVSCLNQQNFDFILVQRYTFYNYFTVYRCEHCKVVYSCLSNKSCDVSTCHSITSLSSCLLRLNSSVYLHISAHLPSTPALRTPQAPHNNIPTCPSRLRTEEWVVRKLHTWDYPTLDFAFLCQNEPFWSTSDGFVKRSRFQSIQLAYLLW